MTGFPNKNTYVIEEASSGLYTPSLCAWEPSHTNDDKVLPSEVLAGEMSALTLESREHGEVLNAESPADTRSSAGSSSSQYVKYGGNTLSGQDRTDNQCLASQMKNCTCPRLHL
ncbi:unnamed protein product [Fusarium graminearum]|nr:unnamed protein product [Fusarium graminearum]